MQLNLLKNTCEGENDLPVNYNFTRDDIFLQPFFFKHFSDLNYGMFSEDVFKTSWSRPIYSSRSYIFKTSSRRFQDIFKTSSKHLTKTSSKRLAKTFSRHLQDVLPRRLQDVLQIYLQGVFKPYHQVKLFLLTRL